MPAPAAARTYTGAPWAPGLPPGVYEERPAVAPAAEVRMDVAAFLGLAERGPLALPVPVASLGEYRQVFGALGGGRLLGDSLRLFFENGGRKAVVLRVADALEARPARWTLGALTAGGAPLRLWARNPGRWGNRLALRGLFRRRRLTLARPAAAAPALLGFEAIATAETGLSAGSLLRLLTRPGSAQAAVPLFVTEVGPDPLGQRLRFAAPLPAEALLEDPAPADPGDRLLVGDEITLDLEIDLDRGRPHGLSERWRDLGLHPDHPRFLVRQLGRRAWSERLAEPEGYDPARPEHADYPALERDRALLPFDARRAGSELVRPEPADWLQAFLPDETLLAAGGDAFRLDPVDLAAGDEGRDGEQTTARDHFFTAPAGGAFAAQPAPLAAVERYDGLNRTEPVSLVAAPDLAHPRQYDEHPLEPEPEPGEGTRFRDCDERVSAPEAPQRVTLYPLLSLGHDRAGLADAQLQLRDWCAARGDTVAILDLPPALSAGEIVDWRSRLSSDRAALYTPYLEVDRSETEALDRLILPPCGAVCGIVARRERERGGPQHAPANELLRALLRLYDDPRLPDSGFLHAERVNEIRVTERGRELLGARTTAADADWTHLSVRRLVDYLKRQIALDLQWATFEPNGPALWRRVRRSIEARLARLFEASAFAGATREAAFFVRCDRTTMSPADLDEGRLVCLVGVAPARPAEFVVFRLTRLGAGGFRAEEGA